MRIQQYTVTDFQGWSEMTLKIKTAYFPFVELEVGFENFFDSHT